MAECWRNNMRKILIFITALWLAACSSQPNLVQTQQPILNIEAALEPLVSVNLEQERAWIKNRTEKLLKIQYDVFWYDQFGVTQPFSLKQDQYSAELLLNPEQKQQLNFSKTSPQAVNYRLYLRLK